MRDAINSPISLFRSCGYNHLDMTKVTIAVQVPDAVDAAIVAEQLPRGNPEVTVVHGGLNIDDPLQETPTVIASAAIEAFLDVDTEAWAISGTPED